MYQRRRVAVPPALADALAIDRGDPPVGVPDQPADQHGRQRTNDEIERWYWQWVWIADDYVEDAAQDLVNGATSHAGCANQDRVQVQAAQDARSFAGLRPRGALDPQPVQQPGRQTDQGRRAGQRHGVAHVAVRTGQRRAQQHVDEQLRQVGDAQREQGQAGKGQQVRVGAADRGHAASVSESAGSRTGCTRRAAR